MNATANTPSGLHPLFREITARHFGADPVAPAEPKDPLALVMALETLGWAVRNTGKRASDAWVRSRSYAPPPAAREHLRDMLATLDQMEPMIAETRAALAEVLGADQ